MRASILFGILVGFAAAGSAAAAAQKPNLVIILVDDMGYGDIAPFGSTLNRTPACDRLAAEGMKLTSFYCAPVCTPSRAQMLTGCYAKRVSLPVVIFPAAKIGLSAKEHTIAQLLKDQGYATECIGKWHVGDQPQFLPIHRGFDHYLGFPYSNDMGGEWDGLADVPPAKRRPPMPLVRDDRVIETMNGPKQDRIEQIYTDEAVKFIRDHKDGPFFLYLAHTAVHVPLHPGAAFRGKSKNGTYGDWVEEVDASTARVMDTIREFKLSENTLVLFTSDNGPWLTQGKNGGTAAPLRGGKGGTYEGGMREPTIAWWPGHVPPGTTCDAVAGEIDVLPTFVKLAGGIVPAERKIDGIDILPLLLGQTKQSPRGVQYYFDANQLQAVREGPWKMAIAPQREQNRPAGQQQPASKGPFPKLYNLDSDIGETTDVAAEHPEVIGRLRKFVEEMDRDLGIKGKGPGVRPPDRVEDPKPLLMKK
ncbi:MAG TPA: sulfatase [Tepidisphaeraceae bacterium]|jgi:arylsulfatase A